MIGLTSRVFQRVMSTFGRWARTASSFFWRLLYRGASAPASAPASRDDDAAPIDYSSVPCIEYVAVPGPWAGMRHPHGGDSALEMPTTKAHPGVVYYISKGDLIAMGSTSLIELLPSGDAVAKTVKHDPIDPSNEQLERKAMAQEAAIYRLLMDRKAPVPNLLHFDAEESCLTLEYMRNGDLQRYISDHNGDIGLEMRQKWAVQAAEALQAVHDVRVIHSDLAPRNLLLDERLDLRVVDFAGSFFFDDPAPLSGAPGFRYQARAWHWKYKPTEADDIFSLASVLFFILTGQEAHAHTDDEEEVWRLFGQGSFPDTSSLSCGSVIEDCWNGRIKSARRVVQALEEVFGDV